MVELQDLKVAVLQEWISARAGSEQVFETIAEAIPHADLFALSRDPSVAIETHGRDITTTFLDHPRLRDRRGATLPLMPLAWMALGTRDYDVVISSHHAFAHTNRLTLRGVHLSYVHTPARYVWNPEIDGRGDAPWMMPAREALKQVDLAASRRVTDYAANSSVVQRRITDTWGRHSRVIHPPVRVEYFGEQRPEKPCGSYVLGVGRWIGYKRLDLVIQLADRAGLPVKIAGRGPERAELEAAARAATVPVELIESPTDEQLRVLYQNARCLVFPTIEDFGMVPVESLAAGTPVVALAAGGTLDTVRHGVTGLLANSDDPQELAALVMEIDSIDRDICANAAREFSAPHFQSAIRTWASEAVTHHRLRQSRRGHQHGHRHFPRRRRVK